MSPTVKIFLPTPSIDGKYTDNYLHAMLRMQQTFSAHNIQFQLRTFVGHSLIPEARTILMRSFLETDCTHLLFVDADIGFETKDLIDMIRADKPIIGGVCVQKRYNWEAIRQAALRGVPADFLPAVGSMFTFDTGEGVDVDTTKREPIRVRRVGFGFTLIKREVIYTLVRTPFDSPLAKFGGSDKPFPTLCGQMLDEDSNWLSEDFSFCEKAKAAGFDTYLAWWTRTTHTGVHTWTGDIVTAAQAANGELRQSQT